MLPTYFYHLGQNPPAESSRVVLSLEANIDCFSYEFQLQSGEVVNAIQVRCTRNVGGHLYIPIHEACLHIAHRFIERATDKDQKEGPVVNGIDSIRSLWEVLYRRVDGSSNPIYVGYLPEPHDYYGGKLCRGLDWELPNDPEDGDVSNYPYRLVLFVLMPPILPTFLTMSTAPRAEPTRATTKLQLPHQR